MTDQPPNTTCTINNDGLIICRTERGLLPDEARALAEKLVRVADDTEGLFDVVVSKAIKDIGTQMSGGVSFAVASDAILRQRSVRLADAVKDRVMAAALALAEEADETQDTGQGGHR